MSAPVFGADLVPIGRIRGAFGLRGEARVTGADARDLRPSLHAVAVREDGAPKRELVVEAVRPHQDALLVRFAGIATREGADELRGALLFAAGADLGPLDPGTYRDRDLIGMRAVDARLGDLGDVRGVLHYPHADMLEVGEKRMLVPLLAAYDAQIDASARVIRCRLPDGFEDLLA